MDAKQEARIQWQEIQDKGHVLGLLEATLAAAGVKCFPQLDTRTETVHITFLRGGRPEKVINVAGDSCMAMLVDIFREAGKDLIEES